jgi:hypothetical protein
MEKPIRKTKQLRSMKDIKDYLHLYLGCDVETTVKGKYVHPYGSVGISVVDADSYENLIRHLKFKEAYQKDGYNDYDWVSVKPILRPLSDMTEEEAWEFVGGKSDQLYDDLKIDKIDKTGIVISYVINAGDEGSFPQSHKFDFFALGPEQLRRLLSRGFDLFNLIPEGLAIDKTTIQKPEVSKEH